MRSGSRRGISTIVATVLIVLITVAAVTIVWVGIAPLLDIDVSGYDTQLSIVTVGGYTFYDPVNKTVTVQVESKGEKAADYVQIILTLLKGDELISVHDAPGLNEVARYYLDVADYVADDNPPIHVSIAPIFIIDGKNVLGLRGEAVKLAKREETPDFYGDRDSVDPTGVHVEDDPGGLDPYTGGDDDDPGDPGDPDPGVLFLPVNACQVLDNFTLEYKLMNDIEYVSGNCFTVLSDGVVLDMDGYEIVGGGSYEGILNNGYDNFEVKNGSIRSFYRGVWLGGGPGNIIEGNIFSNVNISASGGSGFFLDYADNNQFLSVSSSNNNNGLSMDNSNNNAFLDSTFSDNANDGIGLVDSNINAFFDLVVMDNKVAGIRLTRSSDNQFLGFNTLLRNAYGIEFVQDSNDNSFVGISCLSTLDSDVSCQGSVTGNNFTGNYDYFLCGSGVTEFYEGGCPVVSVQSYLSSVRVTESQMKGCSENYPGKVKELEIDLVALGWANGFPFYEETTTSEYALLLDRGLYDSILVCENGYILISDDESVSCDATDSSVEDPLKDVKFGVIAPYGVFLNSNVDPSVGFSVDSFGSMYYCSEEEGEIKYVVVHWNVTPFDGFDNYEFEAQLYEDGTIIFSYENYSVGFSLGFFHPDPGNLFYREIGISSALDVNGVDHELLIRSNSLQNYPLSDDLIFNYASP